MNKLESSVEKLLDVVILKTPSIITGIIILIIGRFVVKFLLNLMRKRFEKRNIDLSIRSFVLSIVRIVLYALLFLTAASTMGIETTSFIAALSAFGLAAGLALQGSLSNFAGGVLILLFRPFEVGDVISSNNGTSGTVERIDILYTTLIGGDGIRVFSPNGPLANSIIHNYTKIVNRRFEYTIGISYDANIKEAREAIMNVLNSDPRILKTPAIEVFVKDLGDSAVRLTVRAWTKKEDFASANNENQEAIRNALDKQQIGAAYPQTEMRIVSDQNGGIDRIMKS
ncbi:mechanosensitive ion channel family protein [Sphingobacterium sp. SRCM116780]|uniref:mechanosensitive ion channel family protein n=1 Tax=Sphingobacterium sp. SRCM116780 TaxID=2907623 RepID=UPI001F416FBD|nr:mechanosensitive ion channel family protein [Sphingobacterium sp. SRCM116780]UIR57924.1 mechanosensitive ion channel family protein [Sphingobacterium sp. SRCM116780]